MFEDIKKILPARVKATTGLLIEPHMLERSKIKRVKPTGLNEQYETSIGIQDTTIVTSSEDSYFVELNTIEQTNLSGSNDYYEAEILEEVSSSLVGTKDN